jgi:tripartite-type tricarboxylate transporter receptor subunit TctC
MNRRTVLRAGLLLIAALEWCDSAAAQSYPERPVRLVVPFAPGGAADFVARAVADPLARRLGQPVVVDNKPGGGATVGATLVANSPPDGYTLLYGTPGPQIVNPFLMGKLPYDPTRAFAPIVRLALVPNVLVVHPSVPARTVKELIDLAKTQPGKINFSSSGVGSSSHLAGELFKTMAGIEIEHVPYKGSGPALQDLLAGNVQMAIDSISVFLPYIRAGTLRALGTATLEPSALLPEVPPIAEQLPGFAAAAENYISARAGTPRPIIERLNMELNGILRSPEIRERLATVGVVTTGGTPEELDDMIKSESAKWKKVIELSGAKAE